MRSQVDIWKKSRRGKNRIKEAEELEFKEREVKRTLQRERGKKGREVEEEEGNRGKSGGIWRRNSQREPNRELSVRSESVSEESKEWKDGMHLKTNTSSTYIATKLQMYFGFIMLCFYRNKE